MVVLADEEMYWSECSGINCKIVKAKLNGSGRKELLDETKVAYLYIVLSGGSLYFTDTKHA